MNSAFATIVGQSCVRVERRGASRDLQGQGRLSTCVPLSNEEVMKRPDRSSIRKTAGICATVRDLAAPFDHQKQTCGGYLELGTDGKLAGYHGQCEAISTKGGRVTFW